MKAIAFLKTGPADVLQQMDLPRPSVAANQVLVRVRAAGVNPSDSLFRSGGLPFVRLQFPFIPGLDVAGVVETVGAAVNGFKSGDAVYGMLPNAKMGGYAEYAVLSSDALVPIPTGLSFAEAAAVPCAALTAIQALQHHAGLHAGMCVLVNGASGGVGSFAVQIAKALGAQVTATTSARNLDWVKKLGVDSVFDYARLPSLEPEQPFDVVLDAVGLLNWSQVQQWLRPGGVGVTVNPLRGNPIAGLRARLSGRRWKTFFVQPRASDLHSINDWLEKALVRPQIEQVYPLESAVQAHRHSESKRVRGKLVLLLDSPQSQPNPGQT